MSAYRKQHLRIESHAVEPMAFAVPRNTTNEFFFWSLLETRPGSARFEEAWPFATGRGVVVGVVDNGVNYLHADLVGAYDTARDFDNRDTATAHDARPDSVSDRHGTQVAGLIAGRPENGLGTIGAAPDVTLTAAVIRYGQSLQPAEVAQVIASQANVDVSNNSWGYSSAFTDNFSTSTYAGVAAALEGAATTGRDGLGTVFVFAGGNSKYLVNGVNRGGDSNFSNFANSRFTIAVGASDENGDATSFSSPGANLLLSAPGQGLLTLDGVEAGATSTTVVAGTSFAAPLVSSAVALMLEVNPNLGYRDVQEILAITARPSDGPRANANGADNVNGGGLVFDRTLGFGVLDAAAAVHLARNWTGGQHTAANEERLDLAFGTIANANRSLQVMTATLAPSGGPGFTLDQVELQIATFDADLRNLAITLISPEGTRSVISENLNPVGNRTYLNFSFSTVEMWGENPYGTWTIELAHTLPSRGFTVYSAALRLYGDADTPDDSHYITSAFGELVAADAARANLSDADGGIDTLNFAAADTAITVDLSGTTTSRFGSTVFTVDGSFENAIGTIHADTLAGNGAANRIVGDYGDDILSGGAGADTLEGGVGNDRLTGGAGSDRIDGGAGVDVAVFENTWSTYTIAITDSGITVSDATGTDTLVGIEGVTFGSRTVMFDSVPMQALIAQAPVITGTNARSSAPPVLLTTTPVGTVVATVSASDANLIFGDRLSFSIDKVGTGLPADLFALVPISSTAVQVVLNRPLDATMLAAANTLVVAVNDLTGLVARQSFTFAVEAGETAPRAISVSGTPSVTENVAGAVAATLTVIDDDAGDSHEVSVDDVRFEVVPSAGGTFQLRLRAGIALDHEAAEGINLTVTAVDKAGLSVSETVTVAVADINEVPVVQALAGSTVSVQEGVSTARLALGLPFDPEGSTLTIRVAALPAAGTLLLDGVPVSLDTVLTLDSFARLTFSAPEAVGSFTLRFVVSDGINAVPAAVTLLVTEAAQDTLNGTTAADTLDGGAGADRLSGGAGRDLLIGGSGNDVLLGGADADTFVGGDGLDFVRYDDAFHGHILISIGNPAASTGVATGDVFIGIEGVVAGRGNDTLIGAASDDWLFGSDGHDKISGQDGRDRLTGGNGNDTLEGEGGADILIGGSGHDRLFGGDGADILYGGAGVDLLDGGAGIDVVRYDDADYGSIVISLASPAASTGVAANDVFRNIEVVVAGAGDDTLIGDALANQLMGGEGHDLLQGAGGADMLWGGVGNDSLSGGTGNDRLVGEAGSDTLHGGTGSDIFDLRGTVAGVEIDHVLDFAAGTDRLLLSRALLGGGQPVLANFVAASVARDGDDRLVYDQAAGRLMFDADGNGSGAAVTLATFTAGTVLGFNDLLFA